MSLPAIDPSLQLVVRASLALLFAVAALHKLRDPGAFRAALARYDLLPPAAVVPGGALLVAAELGVAAGLCLTAVASAAAAGAAALLLLYAAAIGVNLRRGRRDIECGCAGPARRQPLRPALVARNLLLAAWAGAAIAPVGPRQLTWLDAVTVAAAVAAAALLYVAAEGLLAVHGRGAGGRPVEAVHA